MREKVHIKIIRRKKAMDPIREKVWMHTQLTIAEYTNTRKPHQKTLEC